MEPEVPCRLSPLPDVLLTPQTDSRSGTLPCGKCSDHSRWDEFEEDKEEMLFLKKKNLSEREPPRLRSHSLQRVCAENSQFGKSTLCDVTKGSDNSWWVNRSKN